VHGPLWRWLGPVLIGILLVVLAILESLQVRHHSDAEPQSLGVPTPSSAAEQAGSP
jgi:hypothetical protein